jgi:hypothetical protein
VTIAISPTTLSGAVKGIAFSQTLTASGGTAPYTYSIFAGALPTGLGLSSGGVISGTPTVTGYYSFTVRATDNLAAHGDQAYTLYVAGVIYWFICTNAAYPSAIPIVAASQLNFNRQTANAIAGLNTSRHEVGDLLARPIPDPVNNHLLCDGSAVLRANFPQLFDAIGTTWGAGDGTTTFNIPNLIGSLPVATVAPTQTIADTTSDTGGTITQPSGAAQTGGSVGGNFVSGGINRFSDTEIP